MAEFTQTMSGDSRYSIKLTVTEVIPSDYVTTNKTNVNYTLTATKSAGSGYWSSSTINPVKVTINGTDVVNTNISYDFRNATPKTITLASGTVTGIEHNADGSKTIAVSGYFKDGANSLGQATASGNLTLTTIPRASQPTCADVTLGNNVTIYTNRVSNSFEHLINIKIGGTTVETIGTLTPTRSLVGASYSWTPAIATYAPKILNGTQGVATIECITYNGNTVVGTKTTTTTLTVPNNSHTKPTANISFSKGDNVVPAGWGTIWIKGKSKLNVSITGSGNPDAGSPSASITVYTSTTNGNTSSLSSYTTTELKNVGTNYIKAKVTDARGFTSDEASVSYTVLDYSNPQINLSVARCDSGGTLDDSGTYVKYTCTGSIFSLNGNNEKGFTFKYKEKGGDWKPAIFTINNAYTIPNTQTGVIYGSGNIDITKEYVFRLEASDTFNKNANVVYKEVEVGTVADLLNFNASGKSMAIGGVSQRGSSEKALDVFMPTYLQSGGQFSGTQGNSWVKARDSAYIRDKGSSSNGYRPLISAKTPTGEWSIGNFDNENLLFSYTTDANYNANNNVSNKYTLSTGGKFSGSCASADAITNKSFATRSNTGDAGWASTGQQDVVCRSLIAYWNGAYSGTSSNLQYCDRGRFGTIVTKGTGDYTNSINNSGAMMNLTSNWSFSGVTAWANTQVAFNGRCTFSAVNSNFTQNGNGIKCNFAGWVQVVGAVGTDKTNEFDACILKGSTQIIRPINTGGRQSFATAVFQVANGDTVYLGFASGNTSGTIYNTTHFTIMRIS